MKSSRLLTAIAVAGFVCAGAFADMSQFGASAGYMNVFDNNAGAQGGFLWGSGWGIADLQAITSDDATFELLPNTNAYNDTDPYWSDGFGDGNKWMEANVYREHTLLAGETSATMEYSVGAFDLDSRYTLQAFVKTLDPNAGWATTYSDYQTIDAAAGTVSLTMDTTGYDGQILQFGFVMNGLNANPATDWGSATVTMETLDVIPEPATIGLLGAAGVAMLAARRRLRK
ncbi:MAG: PEP-CTERM sorting domain-containing protein [Pontiellaceae bacterium]|nr:PEP-CTERM sorting domain-containing protein [Pontiellaceae bacterium]MBN2785167.1 PEP-CTERM sorting domain-containing protein [Pontiellaceae bacterium]